jgi:transcription termination factor Rho
MSVLDREALEASPLADLHAIASELGLDGYRRLRKADLIDAILDRQDGGAGGDDEEAEAPRPARSRRGGRGRGRATRDADEDDSEDDTEADPDDSDADEDERPARGGGGRGGRGGRGGERERADVPESVEGTIELLPNGAAMIRATPGEESAGDVYVSAAQVRRCELVNGDVVGGPVRPPRRSERHPSITRIETINGETADSTGPGKRFEDLPADYPADRLQLGGDDPTLAAIDLVAPFGKGSRVIVAGAARAGKTEALRRIAGALSALEGLELEIVLAGVRPEEVSAWADGPLQPVEAVSLAGSTQAQAQALEGALERAKRLAARGADAVLLIDTLDALAPGAARALLAAARNIRDGGSLTIVATASRPLGGETTVIALDARLAGAGRIPAVDIAESGTIRPELLVGAQGAEDIARARSEAIAG